MAQVWDFGGGQRDGGGLRRKKRISEVGSDDIE